MWRARGLSILAASCADLKPALRILPPASRHQLQRNLLIGCSAYRLGAVLATSLSEMERSKNDCSAGHLCQNGTQEMEMDANDEYAWCSVLDRLRAENNLQSRQSGASSTDARVKARNEVGHDDATLSLIRRPDDRPKWTATILDGTTGFGREEKAC